MPKMPKFRLWIALDLEHKFYRELEAFEEVDQLIQMLERASGRGLFYGLEEFYDGAWYEWLSEDGSTIIDYINR